MAAPVAWQIKPSSTDRFREDVIYWSRIPDGDREKALEGFSRVTPWLKRVVSLDVQFAWPIGIGLIGSAAVWCWLSWKRAFAGAPTTTRCSLHLASAPHDLLDLRGT
jgi:hypothetical protein